ncbi:MAG: DUF2007 domain-containing protein [Hyphomicrobium sp.]|nr:DUF2007 domain-containing protein [Hyphomicrobium sp.]
MRELLRSNDPVLISFVEQLLLEAGVQPFLMDRNMSILEGSLGVLPCRVLVHEDVWPKGRSLMIEAGLSEWLFDPAPRPWTQS